MRGIANMWGRVSARPDVRSIGYGPEADVERSLRNDSRIEEKHFQRTPQTDEPREHERRACSACQPVFEYAHSNVDGSDATTMSQDIAGPKPPAAAMPSMVR